MASRVEGHTNMPQKTVRLSEVGDRDDSKMGWRKGAHGGCWQRGNSNFFYPHPKK